MLNVFVAEDEELTREGVRDCVGKMPELYNFCGEAPDGEMALPMLQELKPDILITDVRMPFMDGLELAAIVRRTMPWTHIVILSGHDEFEYAQKAVSLSVDAYILKPVDSDKLLSTLQSVTERIQKEKQRYEETVREQKRDETEKLILREHFLSRVVTGAVSIPEALEQGEKQGLTLVAKKYVVCHAELQGLNGDTLNHLRLLGEQLFGKREDIIWFLKGADRFVYIVKGEKEEGVQETAYETAQLLRHELKRYLSIDAAVGIGSIVDRLGELAQSYHDARSVISSVLGMRGSKTLGFSDVKHDRISPKIDFSANVPLKEKLNHISMEDIPKLVDLQFAAAGNADTQSALYRYYLLMDLVVTSARIAGELGASSEDITGAGNTPEKILEIATGHEDTRAFARQVLERLVNLRQQGENVRYGLEIRRAKEFIAQNYADAGISLHTVAAEVGFSPNHFSAVFSQETGETFVEYLTKQRIEQAKRLLLQTNEKLSDIAFNIGYNEPHYFSYIFKKYTGISPREYRSAHGGEQV